MKAVKKPITIEFMQFNRDCIEKLIEFTKGNACRFRVKKSFNNKVCCNIKTLEGVHIATEGDYIIKGINDEFYPCKPDIFLKTYDILEDEDWEV